MTNFYTRSGEGKYDLYFSTTNRATYLRMQESARSEMGLVTSTEGDTTSTHTEQTPADRFVDQVAEICDMISLRSALEQTAEEATELAQACMKLCRKISKDNPTPRKTTEIINQVNEELADVHLCGAVLAGLGVIDSSLMDDIEIYKADRWLKRLRENVTGHAEKQDVIE